MFYLLTKKNIVIITAIMLFVLIGFTYLLCANHTSQTYSPANNYTIVLDAGHGGIDKGVQGVNTKVSESDINLAIVKRMQYYFENSGYKVVLTRKDQDGLYKDKSRGFKARDMAARKKIIEDANADYVVSIHINTYSSSYRRGIQTFYYSNTESKTLANNLQEVINTNLNEPFIGRPLIALHGDYYILKCSSAPSVLIECGFLSNPQDEMLLLDESYRDLLAYYIITGINYYIAANHL